MTGLSLVVAALLALGLASAFVPRRIVASGTLALCGLGLLLDLGFLLGGAAPATLSVPIGLPGRATTLALDGLSGFFLLLLMAAGMASAATAQEDHGEYAATEPFFPVFIGAMALTLLAGDAFALVLGFELMSLASFALVLTRHEDEAVRAAALLYVGMAALGAVCLIPALALLAAGSGWDLRFAAIRAHPPEGWQALAVLLLTLVGAGSKAGLAPLHVWLPPAHAAAPGHVSALMSGAMTKVALYVLIRILFDLCGPAQPLWWGVPLLVLGAAGAVLGGLRANMEGDIKGVLACSTIENIGLITIGLGIALAARAADLSTLAALALGGALLHVMAHGLFKALLFQCAGVVQHAAGSRLMVRLGGLIHRMPVTTACVLVGAASLAALPPSSGFAGEWTLFQAVLGGPRIGGLWLQTLICVVAGLMALAAALAAAAAVRLVGVAFLGRPRSPRASAAEEAGPWARGGMIGLAVASVLVGLLPGGVLGLAEPALRRLLSAGMADRAGLLMVAPQADGAGYIPLALAILLGLALALVVWLVVIRRAPGYRIGPAWDCGFGPPPAWLPFGDPITQYGGASFGQPLRRALGGALLQAREVVDMPEPGETRPARITATLQDPAETLIFRPVAAVRERLSEAVDVIQFLTIRRTLSLMFGALVMFLTVVAVLEQL
ncbi:Hydrogenase 4 subunit B [Rhodovastum atsumiense]|nr:proton-conducting transporter membrane subunit [Rhodovastum atsumiense]CAH2600958.1 Hydrogenase 4 subunit B [Rhodovastum atsumiense]